MLRRGGRGARGPAAIGIALAGVLALGIALRPPIAAAQDSSDEVFYKPPPRGAPGRRLAGASRGSETPLPTIDLLAPDGHAGETASPDPTLYYFVSGPVNLPIQLTISAPRQARPLLETDIPAPRAAGLYPLRLSDFHVQLAPGIDYTWSVSMILDRNARANDVVASASLLRVPSDPALENAVRAAPPTRRPALLAQAGLWYDAVDAAAQSEALDRHAALDALMTQVGLTAATAYDRQSAARGH